MKSKSKIIGLLFFFTLLATTITLLTVSASAAESDVAKITASDGTTVGTYTNFGDALSNWTDGTTLTLLNNVTYEDEIIITQKSVTLDLDGKELTIPSSNYGIRVGNYGANYDSIIPGTLTIKDSATNGKITSDALILVCDTLYFISGSTNCKITIDTTGTAYIQDGNISPLSNRLSAIDNRGTLDISGGTLSGRYGIWTYSNSITKISGSPTIIGTDYNQNNTGCAIFNQGTLSIYGEPTLIGGSINDITTTSSPITIGANPKNSTWKIWLGNYYDKSELGIFAKPAENFTIDPTKFVCPLEGYDVLTNTNGELVICQHSDDDLDHVCDKECGTNTVNIDKHIDGDDQDHLCDYGCKLIADEGCHDTDNDSDHKCDECGADNISQHFDSDSDGDHKCDECGADNISQHLDSESDGDHLCDNGCGTVFEDCTPDADDGDCTTDIKCSVCKKTLTAGADSHTGGTATCTAKAKCDVCKKEYGEVLTHSHSKEFKFDENNHWNECVCGDKTNVASHKDADYDTKCDFCAYEMPLDDPSAPTPDLPEPSSPTNKEETDTDEESENPTQSGGCGSTIALSTLAVIGLLGTAIVIKKKEN